MIKVSKDNYTGCLVGGAIGDALGAPIEFLSISQIKMKFGSKGIVDYMEFENNVGEFTDDTQMTLFTAEALLRAYHRAMLKGIGGALSEIAYESYLRWLHTQNIGINPENYKHGSRNILNGWLINQKALYKQRAPGNACISSLRSGLAGTIDKPINDSKGCGTVMRIAPVGLMYYGDAKTSFQIACELSAITHGHSTGILSAGFFASIISDLSVGIELKKAISKAKVILKKYDKHSETLNAIEAALNLFKKTKIGIAEDIEKLGQGWTAEQALSMAIYSSLVFENDFENGVLYSVNHSGDSDSTGSITGNILGLINGIDKIPQKWINNLRYSEIVEQIACDLHIGVKGDYYISDDDWWEKYPGF